MKRKLKILTFIKGAYLSANYSKKSLNEIAESLFGIYSPERLQLLYSTFSWKNQVLPAAEIKRSDLSKELNLSFSSCEFTGFQRAANNIHIWGFGRPIAAQLQGNPAFWSDLKMTLESFSENRGDDIYKCLKPITRLLTHNRLGIATVSKWVCFVDQANLAIFDSRVSIAMRNVKIEGYRAFPVVARRASKGHRAWRASTLSPIRTANAYIDYLQVLGIVSRAIAGMSVAQIEMALFMAGDVWSNEGDEMGALLPGMWE